MSRENIQAVPQILTVGGFSLHGNTSPHRIWVGVSAASTTKRTLPLFYWWGSQKIGQVPKGHSVSKRQSQKLNSDLPLRFIIFFNFAIPPSPLKGTCSGNKYDAVADLNRRKPRRGNGWWRQRGKKITVRAPEPEGGKEKGASSPRLAGIKSWGLEGQTNKSVDY